MKAVADRNVEIADLNEKMQIQSKLIEQHEATIRDLTMKEQSLNDRLTSMTNTLNDHFQQFFTVEGTAKPTPFESIQPAAIWKERYKDYIAKMKKIYKKNTIKNNKLYIS